MGVVTITDPYTPASRPIVLLHPLVLCGAATIFLAAAWRQYGPRRWASCGSGLAFLTIASADPIQYLAAAAGTPAVQALFLVAYTLALASTALLFPSAMWRDGTILRLVLESTLVGLAALVLLDAALSPLLPPPSRAMRVAFYLPYYGFDIGLLFAVTVVSVRYTGCARP